MEIRHDTTHLKRAVEYVVRRAEIPSLQAEAEAAKIKAHASSRLRVATGGAIALAALGLGLGISLMLMNFDTLEKVETTVESPPPIADQQPPLKTNIEPDPPAQSPKKETKRPVPLVQPEPSRPPDIITENFTKFATRRVDLLGTKWILTAGHHFDSEKQEQWKTSWCYTKRDVDGIDVNIDLAIRNTFDSPPTAPRATQATLATVGLSPVAAIALATECPWLDKKIFTVTEFQPSAGERNPFQPKRRRVTTKGRTLIYSGEIGEDFTSILKRNQFDKIQITSVGGLVVEAIDAGRWLRKYSKKTEVIDECLSACVYLVAGGIVRTAQDGASVGVHRFSSTANESAESARESAQQLSSIVSKYLEDMGISSKLFHKMSAVSSKSIEFIDHATLREWHLLTPAVEQSTIPIAGLTKLDGYDAVGHDMDNMPLEDVTADECIALCESNTNCHALTYNKKFGACFLKSDIDILLGNEIALAAYKKEYEEQIHVSELQFSEGVEVYGRKKRVIRNIEYPACVSNCDKSGSCKGVNYYYSDRLCVTYRSLSGSKKNPKATSGIRYVEVE